MIEAQMNRQTHRHTDTGTDKSLKTEGPKILSNDMFYFKTVIIGGPISGPLVDIHRPTIVDMYRPTTKHKLIFFFMSEQAVRDCVTYSYLPTTAPSTRHQHSNCTASTTSMDRGIQLDILDNKKTMLSSQYLL